MPAIFQSQITKKINKGIPAQGYSSGSNKGDYFESILHQIIIMVAKEIKASFEWLYVSINTLFYLNNKLKL